MKMSYRQVGYVCEVAKQSSIAKACQHLNISQSSVLAAIEAAEAMSSSKLFIRKKGSGIRLTVAGQRFLISARRFLAAGDDFSRTMGTLYEGRKPVLKIGCFSPLGSLLIPAVLSRFIKEYGDTEVILFEGDQTELRTWLSSGAIDLVVTYDLGENFGFEPLRICDLPAHALMHSSNPYADAESVSVLQLAQTPHVLLDLQETRSYLLSIFDSAGRRPEIKLRTRSYETIRSAVANGLGSSLLNMRPPSTSPDTVDLVRVPITGNLWAPTLITVDPYGAERPEYVRSFIQTIYDYIADLGPERFAVATNEERGNLLHSNPRIFS